MTKHFLAFYKSAEVLFVIVNEGSAPMMRTFVHGLKAEHSLSCSVKVEILGKEDFYINPGQKICIIFANAPTTSQLMESVKRLGFHWHQTLQIVVLLHAKVDRSKLPNYACLCWKEKIRAIEPVFKIAIDYVDRQHQ
jgi:hypothetical protein